MDAPALYVYNTSSGVWTSLLESGNPPGRMTPGMAVVDGTLFVFGGTLCTTAGFIDDFYALTLGTCGDGESL